MLGLARLKDPRWVVLTEGVFDWLVLVQWGLPACCALGGHGLEGVARALSRVPRVYLAFDTDPAGAEASRRLQELLGPRAMPVPLPAGAKDVADLALHPWGCRAFLEALRRASRRARA